MLRCWVRVLILDYFNEFGMISDEFTLMTNYETAKEHSDEEWMTTDENLTKVENERYQAEIITRQK